MSNLLLLADVAAKTPSSNSKTTADATVQTEIFYGSEDFGGDNRSFLQRFCTDSCSFLNGGGVGGNLFELPSLPPSHDYVKQTEYDYLVNSTHDYYNRIAPPNRELEHSYAFFDGGTADNNAAGNGIFDDGCFESMANLDEYMGIASQSAPGESLLCEEVIDQDSLMIGRSQFDQNDHVELFDELSGGGATSAVVRLDELDVDELVQYLLPLCDETSNHESVNKDGPDASGLLESVNEFVISENDSHETDAISGPAATSNTNEVSPDNGQRRALQCEWADCGRFIELIEAGSFEQHLLRDHLRKHKGEPRAQPRWMCLWDGCSRKEAFSHRYQLLRHLRSHTMEAPFPCGHCQKTFKSKELLRVHSRRAHNYTKNSSCELCGKSFASTGDLSRHRKTHMPITTSKHFCNDCGSSYKDESGLRKHRQRVHAASGKRAVSTDC